VKVEPRPTSLDLRSSPPRAATIRRAMARPRPVPFRGRSDFNLEELVEDVRRAVRREFPGRCPSRQSRRGPPRRGDDEETEPEAEFQRVPDEVHDTRPAPVRSARRMKPAGGRARVESLRASDPRVCHDVGISPEGASALSGVERRDREVREEPVGNGRRSSSYAPRDLAVRLPMLGAPPYQRGEQHDRVDRSPQVVTHRREEARLVLAGLRASRRGRCPPPPRTAVRARGDRDVVGAVEARGFERASERTRESARGGGATGRRGTSLLQLRKASSPGTRARSRRSVSRESPGRSWGTSRTGGKPRGSSARRAGSPAATCRCRPRASARGGVSTILLDDVDTHASASVARRAARLRERRFRSQEARARSRPPRGCSAAAPRPTSLRNWPMRSPVSSRYVSGPSSPSTSWQ
jgi:hypothetical protein